MGAGILMSRTQANAAMAAARAASRGGPGCGGCPPSAPNGGVTGSQPATGPSPSGQAPSPRQDALHPKPPAGQIARQTGNNPCGGNGNSSSNIAQQGYTQNPNVLPVVARNLVAQPTDPYQPNPTEQPTCQSCSGTGGMPATDAYGSTINPDSKAADDYDQGNADAQMGLPPQDVGNPSYMGGYSEYRGNRARPRPRNRYNTRPLNQTNLRRGVARYI